MAKRKIKDPKAIACIVVASIGFAAVIVFFIIGGILFAKEHPKVLNYANDMCIVDSQLFRTYKCRTRYSQYTCYGAIWGVHYGVNLKYATIEEEKRFRSVSDATNRAAEYKVSKEFDKDIFQ